ncbi:type II toxin -antitoxin system TacA 1-like antitoxin, partial [Acinetobacter harbinensis]
VDNANGQEVEYTRNLMYKIILTPHTGDVKKRFRKEHGRLASVPLYYEEEKVLKEAAGFVGESLNDFIREAVLKEAKRVLGTEKYNLTLGKPFNQTKVKLSEDEHQKLSKER